jgi:transcriptional regulator with XRE-family HTH domain
MRHGPRTREAIGAAIASVRHALGWSQRELARRARVSQSWISRLETGRLARVSFDAADRVFAIMGAQVVITVQAPFLVDRQGQRDPAHARLLAHIAMMLRQAGWLVATEVEVGGDRSRGWIDLLAWHPATGTLLVIEVKTEVHDLGNIQRTLGWYEREAWTAARRLGWRPRAVVGSLLLLATEANDARTRENRLMLDEDFPGRAADLTALVEGGAVDPHRRRAVAMIDPRSRRSAWIRPLRIDGRRTAAPYADYADFMRSSRGQASGRRRP